MITTSIPAIDARLAVWRATVARCDAVRVEAAHGGCNPARLALAEQLRKLALAEIEAILSAV